MNPKIPDLLHTATILRFYEDKLSGSPGDRFNIFQLLGVGSREVQTHNPYLVEFLKSKGMHSLGSRPLAAFIRRFDLPLNPQTTRVDSEVHIGPVTDETGGRLDILLTDTVSRRQVAIESKIFAGDQKNQLQRYQNAFPGALIIYLTLDRRDPHEFTIRDSSKILCLSYAEDIIAWQEDCRREAAGAPLVRETITQYINLLKHLTNQNTNTRMNSQIIETVLKDKTSFAAFNELVNAQNAVHAAVIVRLRAQCEAIATPLGLIVEFSNIAGRYGSFSFHDEAMIAQSISINFQFQTPYYRDLNFGICYLDLEKRDLAPAGICEEFRKVFNDGQKEDWWPAIMAWPNRNNWVNDTFGDIAFGSFQSELADKVTKMLTIVRASQARHVQ